MYLEYYVKNNCIKQIEFVKIHFKDLMSSRIIAVCMTFIADWEAGLYFYSKHGSEKLNYVLSLNYFEHFCTHIFGVIFQQQMNCNG